jgi:membrane fusion protein (multidrug efflux system)
MKRFKKILISAALCLAVVVVGLGVSSALASWKKSGGGQAQAEPVVQEKLPNVAVQVLSAREVEDALYVTGYVEAWEDVTLSAETRGKIEWQGIEEGDGVTEGQELFRVNTTTVQATIDQAKAEFTSSERELARMEKLRENGISSPQEFDKAIMMRDMANARLRLAEIQLDQSVVSAPFDAIVDTLEKEAGEFVDSGTALVRLVQVDRVKIVVGLPEREVAHFATGDNMDLIVDAIPGRRFSGRIHRIATSADLVTRTFLAEVEVDNADGALRPGMVARAKLVRSVLADAITIPLFSVMTREDGRYVYVELEGVAHERIVEVGFVQGNSIHISGGLADGDRLVVAGQRDLRDGARVNVQRVTEAQ